MYHKELVAVRWTDKRDIHALSTVNGDKMTTVRRRDGKEVMEVNCPEIIEEYNSFMGGVDVADQYMSYYGTGRKSMKWWRRIFWRLHDMAIINAYTIYKANNSTSLHKSITQKQFRMQLAYALCAKAISGRTWPGRPPLE